MYSASFNIRVRNRFRVLYFDTDFRLDINIDFHRFKEKAYKSKKRNGKKMYRVEPGETGSVYCGLRN